MTRGIMAQRGEKVRFDKDGKREVTGSVGAAAEIEAALKKGDWNEYVIIAKAITCSTSSMASKRWM